MAPKLDLLKVRSDANRLGLVYLRRDAGNKHLYRIVQCGHIRRLTTSYVAAGRKIKCDVCLEEKVAFHCLRLDLEYIGKSGERKNTHVFRRRSCGHTLQRKYELLYNSDYLICEECNQARYGHDAEKLGLEYIGRVKKSRNHEYKHKACGSVLQMEPKNVSKGTSVKCATCLDEKLVEEAERVGLKLVGAAPETGKREYEFECCGARQIYQMTQVRNGQVECQSCKEELLRPLAEKKGFRIQGRKKGGGWAVVCEKCGSTRKATGQNLRLGYLECKDCFERQVKMDASEKGLSFIGISPHQKHTKATTYAYQFNDCGHICHSTLSNIRSSITIPCETCRYESWIEDAAGVGLVLLGVGSRGGYMRYRFQECGHIRELYRMAVKANEFICVECNQSPWDLPAKVYLFQIQSGSEKWLKLGYAKEPLERAKKYGLPEDAVVELLKEKQFESGHEAHEFEQALIKKFNEDRIPVERMVPFHSSGARECFRIGARQNLLAAL